MSDNATQASFELQRPVPELGAPDREYPGLGRTPPIRRRLGLMIVATLLLLYVGAYAVLSRRGYAEADSWHMYGFYYFTPEDSDGWRLRNYTCVWLFSPINAVDRFVGLGRPPAAEPLYHLSRGSS
jgi:hypothetical protein